jgi:uncharacterized membrane protein YphA (DoxX/SURF4 family)
MCFHDSHQPGNREKRMNPVNLGPDRLLAGERAASMEQCNAGRAHRRVMSRALELSSLFLRIALGTSFLSAVADRLGLWGGFGQPNVSWGSFARFVAYTATLNWFLPKAMIPALAIIATCAEILLGLCLIVGWQTRVAAWGAGILLTTFAITLAAALGFKAPLDFSVFSAAGGAFLLASCWRSDSAPTCCDTRNQESRGLIGDF